MESGLPIRTIDDWADAIEALPGDGPLTRRVVVVPNARVGHALRRRLLERERCAALAGTLFANLTTLAVEVLACAGVKCRAGEEALRVARVGDLFKHPPPLCYFDPELLRTTPGWEDAFARSITELEAAGLSPAQLASRGGATADVAAVWAELRKQAGESWSSPRLQAEAAACLERDSGRWRLGSVTLAAVTGHESAMQARLLRAIPNVQILSIVARPFSDVHLDRVDQIYGKGARDMLVEPHVPDAVLSERDRLAARFFAPPGTASAIAAPAGGRDGTAELEEYAGVEAEIEAAVEWVTREVLECGTPLGELAILMPHADPYVDLLVERLAGLPWPATDDGELPVFVANGTTGSACADGARWLALVRALNDNLGLDSLAALIPALRTEGDVRLSRGGALQLLQVLGTVGGSPAHPEGALDWMPRAERRAVAFVREMQRPPDGTDEASGVYERQAAERMAKDLAAIRPALAALCGVAERVVRGAGLAELWAALSAFAEAHLRTLQGARTLARMRAAVLPLCGDSATASTAGHEALALLEGLLVDLRQGMGRYGQARLYIGTVHSAVGLPFTSVRVLGLSEGRIPSTPREDPVLPDALRVALKSLLPTSADRLRLQLHALDRVVRGAAKRIVFSAPRLGPERSQREPSAVFIEAALAIGRSPGVPNHSALERDYFRPARRALREYRLREPVLQSAGLERAALLGASDADADDDSSAFSQRRMRGLLGSAQAGPLDGLLGRDVLRGLLPGLSADRPISASKLRELLECPHRFLLQHLLGFKAPPGVPATTEFDSLTYGKLMHCIVERFSNEHGTAFGAREHDLVHFRAEAEEIALGEFDTLLERYPLGSRAIVDQQRRRMLHDLRTFIDYDWDDGRARSFVAAERPFGWSAPFSIAVDGQPLYLRGEIDRLDIQDGRTVLRDLKTGKPKPRRPGEAPDHLHDLQIGLYALVSKAHAKAWSLPAELDVAYIYPKGSRKSLRRFADEDYDVLEGKTQEWLKVARGLLRDGAFPRTPRADDCRFCDFKPVCGVDANERGREVITQQPATLTDFGDLKEKL